MYNYTSNEANVHVAAVLSCFVGNICGVCLDADFLNPHPGYKCPKKKVKCLEALGLYMVDGGDVGFFCQKGSTRKVEIIKIYKIENDKKT
jgi:hypothetical protein